jgi:protein-S-isoprenylcysteine O-methyltransferase Ste14
MKQILPPTYLFASILKFRFVALEERAMAARFGDDYSRYCTRVRRWL